MNNLKIKEFIRSFQNNSLLHGVERVTLLQKVTAAAIAYKAPCFNGMPGELGSYFRNSVLSPAISIVTDVNENFIINTDDVLKDVKLIWEGRYEMLNSPVNSTKIASFHNSLIMGQLDISDKYEYWIRQMLPMLNKYFTASEF